MLSILAIVPFFALANAVNDWSTPCVKGQCSYDLPGATGSSGTMKIWGSENAITDITQAAGWQILDCDPKVLSQNIRLVCTNGDPSSLCAHLEQNGGAVNKIVRLPENCGANAFARVSKSWIPDDQSVPASIKARVFRRDGKVPVVKALAIDTDFDAVDWSKTGKVNIAIQASNAPAAGQGIQVPGTRRARRFRRGVLGGLKSKVGHLGGEFTSVFGQATADIASVATEVVGGVTSIVGDVTSDVASLATAAASAVQTAAGSVESVINQANSIDDSKTFSPDSPFVFNQKKNIFNTSTDCGATSASLSVDIEGNVNITPTFTLTVNGTLAPPEFQTFKAVTTMTGQLAGTLTIGADITGHVDSGAIQLLNIGVPGFDFPGVLEVGPFFSVDAEFTGDVDLEMDMAVGINFNVNNAQLTFPADDASKPDSNAFSIGDTPLQLSASPSVKATGTLTAHLIPKINLGIKAAAGKADATVFLALDTSASLVLSLDASAGITKTIGDNSTAFAAVSSADASTATSATDPTAATKRDDTTTSGSFGGCVQVNAGLDINAGAEGEFFSLLKDVAKVSLFTKQFQIFKKCFGDGATVTAAPTRRAMRRLSRRSLFSCPATGSSAPQSVTDGTISASSIAEA